MQIGFDSSECYVFPSILFYSWNSYWETYIFHKEPIKMYARYLSIGIYSSCIRAGRFFRKHKRQQGIRVLMSKICCSYMYIQLYVTVKQKLTNIFPSPHLFSFRNNNKKFVCYKNIQWDIFGICNLIFLRSKFWHIHFYY